MNKNTGIKKLAAMVLIAVFIITGIVYKVQADNKAKNSNLASSKPAGNAAAGESSSGKSFEYESIFKKDDVIDIKVEIPEADLKSILDNPTAEEYKSANVTVNGVTVQNAGFRVKGNLTLRSVANTDSDRYSFRIKLDEYVKGQNIMGLDEFVVNNMYTDPSYMREYLSYEALRETGAYVPETVFANLYINGKLHGFYLCVEAIDDSFLERNFGNNDGSLYKQEKGSTLQYKEGGSYDSYEFKEGADETKADLINFIKTLNQMPSGQKGDIEKVLDVDSALNYIAANTVLGNYDSYSGNMAQNYYLYGQDGKFTVIPWDYNMSMGGFGAGGNAATIPIDEPVSGVSIKNLPLINNLLAVPEYKEKYREYVKEFTGYLENMETRVSGLAGIIRPYVQADPTKFYTMEQFEANIKYDENAAAAAGNNMQNPAQPRPDATAGAKQNTNGNQPQLGQRQRPEGMQGGFRGEFQGGDMMPPQDGGKGPNMQGGPNGGRGGMMGGSIINYARDRVENIKKQLSGELPTTGNTTMNSGSMRQ